MLKAASKSRMEMAEDEIPDHRAQDLSEEQLNQAYSLTHGNFGLMIPDQTYSIKLACTFQSAVMTVLSG